MTKTVVHFFICVYILWWFLHFFFAINRCFIAMNLWLLGHLMHQARNVDLEAWLAWIVWVWVCRGVINYHLSLGRSARFRKLMKTTHVTYMYCSTIYIMFWPLASLTCSLLFAEGQSTHNWWYIPAVFLQMSHGDSLTFLLNCANVMFLIARHLLLYSSKGFRTVDSRGAMNSWNTNMISDTFMFTHSYF